MLQILRNKAQSIVIQALVVIIALVFIFWGVGANLMNNREAALVVNDEEISFQEFQIAYDRTITNLKNQFGGNIPQGLLENLGIKEQVINQLIEEALLRQGADEMGLIVSREEIQDTIQNMPQFLEGEVFSLDKYKSILAVNSYSPHKFEETVSVDMLAQKANLNISNFAATATDFEIEDIHKLDKSTVAVKYVKISPTDYLGTVTSTDEDLAGWYATVQDNYKTDPQIKLKYLDFSYDRVGEKITIDEEAIKKYYQDNVSEFSTPEQRRARHILIKADDNNSTESHESQKKKAQEILEIARNGSDFSELAKQYSEGPTGERGGDLGFFARGQMVKPFDDAVFSMSVGDISEVVQTSFGYHIIKLEGITSAVTKPFEEEKPAIMKKLQVAQGKQLAFQVANESYESIIGAGSLKTYLENNPDMKVITTRFFSKNNPPNGVGNDLKFLNAAFALKKGELSSLVETANGYVILFADDVKQPSVPTFADVKEEVLQDYRKNKADEMASQTATTLLQKAKDGSSLSSAAEMGGFSVEDSGYLAKNTPNEKSSFPAPMIEVAFNLSAKEPFPAETGKHEGSFYIFEFVGQKAPEDTLTEEEKENYRSAIIRSKQQQILSAWLKSERLQAKIFTHKSL